MSTTTQQRMVPLQLAATGSAEAAAAVAASSSALVPTGSRAVTPAKPNRGGGGGGGGQRTVIAHRTAGKSPFDRATSKEDVLALQERTRESRVTDPRLSTLKFYNQLYALVLTSEHIPAGTVTKSGTQIRSSFSKYQLLIERIPLQEQNMPKEVGYLDYTPLMPARLMLVKRIRFTEAKDRANGLKPIPLHYWVESDASKWEYMELTEGTSVWFADYNGKACLPPGTRVRLIDMFAQAIDKQQAASSSSGIGGGDEGDAGALADMAAQGDQDQQQQQHHHGGGGGGGDDASLMEHDQPRAFATHHLKAYMQPLDEGGSHVPFAAQLLERPASARYITNVMEVLVREQLMAELGMRCGRAALQEIYQINPRNQGELEEAYRPGPASKPFSFLALVEPSDPSSLLFITNNGLTRLPNFACVAEGVQRSPETGIDFLYLMDIVFKSSVLWDMFGTPNADKWVNVAAAYMTRLVFFALLSVPPAKSADAHVENAALRDEYMQHLDVPAIRDGRTEPVVDVFAEPLFLPNSKHMYRAIAFVNVVFLDPNQLWNWTIPVKKSTLDKLLSRWIVPDTQRIDPSKFRENPYYTCISELRVQEAKTRYASVDKEQAGEYRLLIANPTRFLEHMPVLSAQTPEIGSEFIETICFFDARAKAPSMPAKFAQPPFNFDASLMFSQNTKEASECLAYVFTDSAKWRTAAAAAPLPAQASASNLLLDAPQERYDRQRDRSPVARHDANDDDDPFAQQ